MKRSIENPAWISRHPRLRRAHQRRTGTIIVLTVALLIAVFAFTAFTVDVGYITVTKGQLSSTADASSLGAGLELIAGFGPGAEKNTAAVDAAARQAAVTVAGYNRAGDVSAVYADSSRDVRLGTLQWDAAANDWVKTWGTTPYNMAEVTLRRDQTGGSNGDRPLPLFFAPVIGHDDANLNVTSTAALLPGVGFRIKPGSGQTIGILPITLDVGTWNNLMAGVGSDNYTYNPTTKAVSSGGDGIREVNLYPTGSNLMPPGNRGTVDIGSPNNSTSDLNRQILDGLNEFDLSFFAGELRFDDVPLTLNGDTGLSAGIKEELAAIKGQPRAIPIFSSVSGPGNNAMYTIVKFVGIRILDVKLTGSPSQKHVTVQPAPFMEGTVIPGKVTLTTDSILSPVSLIR